MLPTLYKHHLWKLVYQLLLTVQSTKNEVNLYRWHKRRKPLLTTLQNLTLPNDRYERWPDEYLQHILWSDETKINLFGSDVGGGVQLVWHGPEQDKVTPPCWLWNTDVGVCWYVAVWERGLKWSGDDIYWWHKECEFVIAERKDDSMSFMAREEFSMTMILNTSKKITQKILKQHKESTFKTDRASHPRFVQDYQSPGRSNLKKSRLIYTFFFFK